MFAAIIGAGGLVVLVGAFAIGVGHDVLYMLVVLLLVLSLLGY